MRNLTLSALLLGAAALAAGCESSGSVLEVDATGSVTGGVYRDINGNGVPDAPTDQPFRNVEVRLLSPGSGAVVARATTDTAGLYTIRDVPVGRYQVTIDPARLGDSLQATLLRDITVVPDSAVQATVPVSFPRMTVEQARSLPAGRRVFVEGLVVAAYADTAHISSGGRAIRTTRLQSPSSIDPNNLPGDSVRVLGTTGRFRGQPILDNATLFVLTSIISLPAPTVLTTAAAASGGGGTLDATQVQVRNATLVDTVNAEGRSFLRLDDGSGPVDVPVGSNIAFANNRFIPGLVVNLTGVVVPGTSEGSWWLRPNTGTSLEVVGENSPFRPAAPSAAAAARVPAGVRVTWADNSANETTFRIERRGGVSSAPVEVGTVGAGAREFVDVTAAVGTAYAYQVRACNGKVCSAPSNEAVVGPT
ncbi:MAG: SdrD B-like domain-containing protein [Gemmatimonadota bacterium]